MLGRKDLCASRSVHLHARAYACRLFAAIVLCYAGQPRAFREGFLVSPRDRGFQLGQHRRRGALRLGEFSLGPPTCSTVVVHPLLF